MKRALIAVIAMLALITLLFLTRARDESAERAHVATVPAKHVAAEGVVEARPGHDVTVGADLDARIAAIFVNEGDRVEKGQPIVQLENGDLVAKLREAEQALAVARAQLDDLRAGAREEEIRQAVAALEGAQVSFDRALREYERYRSLHERGMVPESGLEERERAYRLAETQLEEARARHQLVMKGPRPETVRVQRQEVARASAAVDYFHSLVDKTSIESPIAGTVTRRFLDEGESVTPELPILVIVDVDNVWINAEVDETDIGRFRVGDPASVSSIAFPGQVFQGHVEQIADVVGARTQRPENPAVNLGLKVVQTKIALAQKTPLKLGMTVDVRIVPEGR